MKSQSFKPQKGQCIKENIRSFKSGRRLFFLVILITKSKALVVVLVDILYDYLLFEHHVRYLRGIRIVRFLFHDSKI